MRRRPRRPRTRLHGDRGHVSVARHRRVVAAHRARRIGLKHQRRVVEGQPLRGADLQRRREGVTHEVKLLRDSAIQHVGSAIAPAQRFCCSHRLRRSFKTPIITQTANRLLERIGTRFADARIARTWRCSRFKRGAGPRSNEGAMSLVRLLGFTTLNCGCVVGRYREVATSREVSLRGRKGQGLREPRASAEPHRRGRPAGSGPVALNRAS